jgi:8-oxo-dGTP diphosphatase
MIYRRKTYRIIPEKIEAFNEFFRDYLLPNQLKYTGRGWLSSGE